MADDSRALAGAVRDGDPAAEAALVERYRPGVAMILRRLVRDAALADDLTQEVFRIAFEALRAGRLEDDGKLAAYIWAITRNVGNGELRRQHHQTPRATGEGIVDPGPRPDQALLRSERAQRVREAIRMLSLRDRRLLEDFYLRERSKTAICQELRLSPARFDVIKWRALKRLRRQLGEEV